MHTHKTCKHEPSLFCFYVVATGQIDNQSTLLWLAKTGRILFIVFLYMVNVVSTNFLARYWNIFADFRQNSDTTSVQICAHLWKVHFFLSLKHQNWSINGNAIPWCKARPLGGTSMEHQMFFVCCCSGIAMGQAGCKKSRALSVGAPKFQAHFFQNDFPAAVKISTSGYQTVKCFIGW